MLISNAAVIGSIVLEKKNFHRRGIFMQNVAYKIDRHLLGNHIKTSITLSNIARIYSKLGDARNSLQYQMKVAKQEVAFTGKFNFYLLEKYHGNRAALLEDNLCRNMSLNISNATSFWKHEAHTTELSFSNDQKKMLYQLPHTILDQHKVWNNEFDLLFSSSKVGLEDIFEFPKTMLNIPLLASNENINNTVQCNTDHFQMNEILWQEKFPYQNKDSLTENDYHFSNITSAISKHISHIQNSSGNGLGTSIMKFLLGQLHMARNDQISGLELCKEAFEILAKPGMLKTNQRKYVRKAKAESLLEFYQSSILLYGAHPQMQNISYESLMVALHHHETLGNKLEVSQILLAAGKSISKNDIWKAQRIFVNDIFNENFWKLSSYYKVFLSPNDQHKQEARQAYEYSKLVHKLGQSHEEGTKLMKMAIKISKKAFYFKNCEPLLFRYSFFRDNTDDIQNGLSLAYVKRILNGLNSDNILQTANLKQLCGLESIDQRQFIRAAKQKLTKLDVLKEMILQLKFKQSNLIIREHFINATESIHHGFADGKFLHGSHSLHEIHLVADWAFELGTLFWGNGLHQSSLIPLEHAFLIHKHFLGESIAAVETLIAMAKSHKSVGDMDNFYASTKLYIEMLLSPKVFVCEGIEQLPPLALGIGRECHNNGKTGEGLNFLHLAFEAYNLIEQNCTQIDDDNMDNILFQIYKTLEIEFGDLGNSTLNYILYSLLETIASKLRSKNYSYLREDKEDEKHAADRFQTATLARHVAGLMQKHNLTISIQYYVISCKILQQFDKHSELLMTIYIETALTYLKLGYNRDAIQAFNSALNISNVTDNYIYLSNISYILGKLYQLEGLYNESIKPLSIAIDIYDEHQFHNFTQLDAIVRLSKAYSMTKQYQNCLDTVEYYLKLYTASKVQYHSVLHEQLLRIGLGASLQMKNNSMLFKCLEEHLKLFAAEFTSQILSEFKVDLLPWIVAQLLIMHGIMILSMEVYHRIHNFTSQIIAFTCSVCVMCFLLSIILKNEPFHLLHKYYYLY